MIVIVFCALGLMGSVAALFAPLLVIRIATAVCILAAGISAILLRRRGQLRTDQGVSSGESPEPVPDVSELIEASEEREEKILALQNRIDGLQGDLSGAAGGGILFQLSMPLIGRLVSIVNDKAETATLQVTENIFSVAERSLSYNRQVRGLLEDLFTVDQGLERDIRNLVTIASSIELIVADHRDLGANYLSTLKAIGRDVKNIFEATGNITDLAGATSVLAINASIEAARMGEHGKGFAVIAQGVQKIAKQFHEIASQIDTSAKEAESVMKSTFGVLSERAEKSVSVLESANNELKQISTTLGTQIRIIELSLKESKDFSGQVSSELNEITISLQFQDLISQVTQHVLLILEDVQQRINKNLADYFETTDVGVAERELQEIVRGKLTAKEEWRAAGIDETEDAGDVAVTSGDEELKGDIELF